MVPARIAARRLDGDERPVTVFNWHLFHDSEETGRQSERVMNVEEVINRATALIDVFPDAFNKEGVADVKHPNNRFILMGDSNGRNHQCGEFTWWVRRLREEFGYVVDVSTAAVDANNRTWDMHYSGAPLTDNDIGVFGDCNNPFWAATTSPDGAPQGCPFQFQHRQDWNSDQDFSEQSWFPWWAATSRHKDFTERAGTRFDTIILVGRGWADDDPVLTYKVMSDNDRPSPANDYAGGGVEMWATLGDCTAGAVAANQGYAPGASIHSCGTSAGAPALASDHKPVGARLRIYAR
jgi:hypothetical protein